MTAFQLDVADIFRWADPESTRVPLRRLTSQRRSTSAAATLLRFEGRDGRVSARTDAVDREVDCTVVFPAGERGDAADLLDLFAAAHAAADARLTLRVRGAGAAENLMWVEVHSWDEPRAPGPLVRVGFTAVEVAAAGYPTPGYTVGSVDPSLDGAVSVSSDGLRNIVALGDVAAGETRTLERRPAADPSDVRVLRAATPRNSDTDDWLVGDGVVYEYRLVVNETDPGPWVS